MPRRGFLSKGPKNGWAEMGGLKSLLRNIKRWGYEPGELPLGTEIRPCEVRKQGLAHVGCMQKKQGASKVNEVGGKVRRAKHAKSKLYGQPIGGKWEKHGKFTPNGPDGTHRGKKMGVAGGGKKQGAKNRQAGGDWDLIHIGTKKPL